MGKAMDSNPADRSHGERRPELQTGKEPRRQPRKHSKPIVSVTPPTPHETSRRLVIGGSLEEEEEEEDLAHEASETEPVPVEDCSLPSTGSQLRRRRRNTPQGGSEGLENTTSHHGEDSKSEGKAALEGLQQEKTVTSGKRAANSTQDDDSDPSPGKLLLVTFFCVSCLVAILISILWCRWSYSKPCQAMDNLLSNFADHMAFMWTKGSR